MPAPNLWLDVAQVSNRNKQQDRRSIQIGEEGVTYVKLEEERIERCRRGAAYNCRRYLVGFALGGAFLGHRRVVKGPIYRT